MCTPATTHIQTHTTPERAGSVRRQHVGATATRPSGKLATWGRERDASSLLAAASETHHIRHSLHAVVVHVERLQLRHAAEVPGDVLQAVQAHVQDREVAQLRGRAPEWAFRK